MKPVMPGNYEYITAESSSYQILLPLLYFEIFSYPLTKEEILGFCSGKEVDASNLLVALDTLVSKGCLFKIENFYLTQNQPEWVSTRKENNERAKQYIEKAKFMTKIIRRFPFVRGVLVSGSLSKNVMPKDGDIDYFIITQPNRLWISRSFLVIFKKLFLFNSHKYFCVNYFVDENNLEIEEQNRFTATEVATLLPLYSRHHYNLFAAANSWITQYYPHYPKRAVDKIKPQKSSIIQRILELPLRQSLGDRLDNWFMGKTITYWAKKFNAMDPESFAIALKSRKHVSKHHPQNFQIKVEAAYLEKIRAFEERNQVSLEPVPFTYNQKSES